MSGLHSVPIMGTCRNVQVDLDAENYGYEASQFTVCITERDEGQA
jgi:hypothetical protein